MKLGASEACLLSAYHVRPLLHHHNLADYCTHIGEVGSWSVEERDVVEEIFNHSYTIIGPGVRDAKGGFVILEAWQLLYI